MDIDSILYIVITLAILIISGLSGRKRKQAQMEAAKAKASGPAGAQDGEVYEPEDVGEASPDMPGNIFETFKSSQSPLERLEQILTGQVPRENQVPPPYQSMEGESMEGETMEDTVDEEEQILADIRKRNEEISAKTAEDEPETLSAEPGEIHAQKLPGLFADVDEIKKAVIYSEILNRKY